MRINNVKMAQKDQGPCIACGEPVLAGGPYQWARAFRGPKIAKHATCRPFKQSELTANPTIAAVYRVQEELQDSDITDPIEMATFLEACADDLQEPIDQYRESSENIADAFGHTTEQSEQMEADADSVEEWAEELRNAAEDIREIGGEDEVYSQDQLTEVSERYEVAAGQCPL